MTGPGQSRGIAYQLPARSSQCRPGRISEVCTSHLTKIFRKHSQAKKRDAFTLVEALLAAVILAMTVSAIVMPFVAGAQNDLVSARGALAITLAQDLMEEILARPFSDPDDGDHANLGPDNGETPGDKQTFDNIDDYDNYAEPAGHIQTHQVDIAVDPMTATLSRSAVVAYVYVSGQDTSKPPTCCRVGVMVSNGTEALVTLSRLVYANE